jgi:hypothetical protein
MQNTNETAPAADEPRPSLARRARSAARRALPKLAVLAALAGSVATQVAAAVILRYFGL